MKYIRTKFLFNSIAALILASCTNVSQIVAFKAKQFNTTDIKYSDKADSLKVNHKGLYGFSVNMLQKMVDGEENTVASPLGVAVLYRMLEDGASGKTEQELEQIFNVSSEEISQLTKSFSEASSEDDGVCLEMANLLAYHKTTRLKPLFKSQVQDKYLAEVQQVNFHNPLTLDKLNNWVEEKTHGKIKKGIDKLDCKARICAINTVYFKGYWRYEFDEDETKEMPFVNSTGMHTVNMMYGSFSENILPYCNMPVFQAIKMPYDSHTKKDYSMYVLLPHKDKSLNDVVKYLESNTLDSLQSRMYYVNSDYDLRVNLWLPKFEINTRINLVKMLKNMGFNPSNYFTEMADTNMILNESYQKATIDVNEKYTEAAAMSVAITAVGAYYKPEKIVNMKCDHPFIYLIVDEETNTILFMGTYQNGFVKRDGKWQDVEYKGTVQDDNPNEKVSTPTYGPSTNIRQDRQRDVYDIVDEMPSFSGGNAALINYIKENVQLQKDGNGEYIQGRVIVSFIVEKDGSCSNFNVARPVNPLLDREAIRVLKTMPRWNPGKKSGKNVRVRYNVPVMFKLN